ncbi:MAG TPA: Panacea domain-containing protein, partial [Thermodesulfovibrionales bacterium]|nr:Panacea domain-containing protein [Thermodesulfovibrionales bacterium]
MDRKLKELILYIADKCKDDPSFGATKLNKILFLADMNYYALHGKSITGSTYIHKPNGPVAKRMLPALHSLKKEKSATILEDLYFGYVRKKVVPGRGPNMSLFTEEQISLVTFLVEKTMGMTATEISRWSHT